MAHEGLAVLSFAEDSEPASRLAGALSVPRHLIERHTFPDGESLVRVPPCSTNTVLYAGLDHPNAKILDLCFAASTARGQGAQTLALIAPYLPYMRQDKAFQVGEAVSQRIFCDLLSGYVDAVVTVDPHLHRVRSLAEVFPRLRTQSVSASACVAHAIRSRFDARDIVIIGPDEESAPLIQGVADTAQCAWMVGTKHRHGDRDVTLSLPDRSDLSGKIAVIFDDVISSGTTICAVSQAAIDAGAAAVHAYTTHALFNEADEGRMRNAGVASIISCDSVPHATNGIALASVLAEAVTACL